MPTYVTLLRYTQKGIESIKDGPTRLENAKKMMDAGGGKLIGFYLTMGQYDAVAVVEYPNDEAVARSSLAGAAQGYVRSETMRAFTEDEYKKIVGSLP
jgi:uncharacterized protein with GYD domain